MPEQKFDLTTALRTGAVEPPEPPFTPRDRYVQRICTGLKLCEIIDGSDHETIAVRAQMARTIAHYALDASSKLGVLFPSFSLLDQTLEDQGVIGMQLIHYGNGLHPKIAVSSGLLSEIGLMMLSPNKKDSISAEIILGHYISHEVRHEYQYQYQPTLKREDHFLQTKVALREEQWNLSEEYFCSRIELGAEDWAIGYLEMLYQNLQSQDKRQVWKEYLKEARSEWQAHYNCAVENGWIKNNPGFNQAA